MSAESKKSRKEKLKKVSDVIEHIGLVVFIVLILGWAIVTAWSKGMQVKQNKIIASVNSFNSTNYGWVANKKVGNDSLKVLLTSNTNSDVMSQVQAICETLDVESNTSCYYTEFLTTLRDRNGTTVMKSLISQLQTALEEYEFTSSGWFIISNSDSFQIVKCENGNLSVVDNSEFEEVQSNSNEALVTLREFETALQNGKPFIFTSPLFDFLVSEDIIESYEVLLDDSNNFDGYGISEISQMFCVKLLHEFSSDLYSDEYQDYVSFCDNYC